MGKNAMELYGDREVVNEMTMRLVKAMPGAKKLSAEEARTLAQISVAHGLDPFNGEAWFIPGSGVMVGIKGLRKCAKRQIKAVAGDDAIYWGKHKRIADPSEYGADEDDVVYEYHLTDTETFGAWTKSLMRLKDAGFELAEAKKIAGDVPVTVGIGIVRAKEKTRMEKHQCAKKRAEADGIKQRFDVEFMQFDVDHDVSPSIDVSFPPDEEVGEGFIDGEVVETEPEGTVGYIEAVKIRQEVMALINKHSQKEASKQFRGMLAGAMKRFLGTDDNRYLVSEFLFGVKSTKEMSGGQVYAMNEWVSSQKPELVEERMGVLLQGVREMKE